MVGADFVIQYCSNGLSFTCNHSLSEKHTRYDKMPPTCVSTYFFSRMILYKVLCQEAKHSTYRILDVLSCSEAPMQSYKSNASLPFVT